MLVQFVFDLDFLRYLVTLFVAGGGLYALFKIARILGQLEASLRGVSDVIRNHEGRLRDLEGGKGNE